MPICLNDREGLEKKNTLSSIRRDNFDREDEIFIINLIITPSYNHISPFLLAFFALDFSTWLEKIPVNITMIAATFMVRKVIR